MVGRNNKTKICDKESQGDWISKLPDDLISAILTHLPTKDVVRTSLLSTRWRNLWQCVVGLDLDSTAFSDIHAFKSFVQRYFYSSYRKSSIHKIRLTLRISESDGMRLLITPWIDYLTTQRIQHLDLDLIPCGFELPTEIPLSIYTCKTLVHLCLCRTTLAYAEFVSLPCLKIIRLEFVSCPNKVALEKLVSGPPVLEDLTLILCSTACNYKVLQVRSHTLKRLYIDDKSSYEIDAPFLQFLRIEFYGGNNFNIINLGFSTKLDVSVFSQQGGSSNFRVLTYISKVRGLVLRHVTWEEVFGYLVPRPLFDEFRHLSRLEAKFWKSDLERLPTILESCPKLESLILELVKDPVKKCGKAREPNVMFSTVPQCLVTSLKFVELKRSIPVYDAELELVRYFLRNSKILKILRIDISSCYRRPTWAFFKEIMAMQRCSSTCQVLILHKLFK